MCMPTITIKDIPQALHRALKLRAEAHHRSLNKEVIATLEAAALPSASVSTVTPSEEAAQARSQFKRSLSVQEITSWKRQGRL